MKHFLALNYVFSFLVAIFLLQRVEANPSLFVSVRSGIIVSDEDFSQSIVGIQVLEHNGPGWVCSGSVIHERYILTAAHCFNDGPHMQILAVFDNRLRTHDDNRFIIDDYFIHPLYRKGSEQSPYDLALIRLSKELPDHYKPIDIASTLNSQKVDNVTVAGFGRSYERLEESLRFAEMKVDHDVSHFEGKLIVSPREGHNVCEGDSGGPVMFNNQLIGVIRSSNCHKFNTSGFYIKVSHRMIENLIEQFEQKDRANIAL